MRSRTTTLGKNSQSSPMSTSTPMYDAGVEDELLPDAAVVADEDVRADAGAVADRAPGATTAVGWTPTGGRGTGGAKSSSSLRDREVGVVDEEYGAAVVRRELHALLHDDGGGAGWSRIRGGIFRSRGREICSGVASGNIATPVTERLASPATGIEDSSAISERVRTAIAMHLSRERNELDRASTSRRRKPVLGAGAGAHLRDTRHRRHPAPARAAAHRRCRRRRVAGAGAAPPPALYFASRFAITAGLMSTFSFANRMLRPLRICAELLDVDLPRFSGSSGADRRARGHNPAAARLRDVAATILSNSCLHLLLLLTLELRLRDLASRCRTRWPPA